MNYLNFKSSLFAFTLLISPLAYSNNAKQTLEDCTANLCKTDDGIVVEIVTKGESKAAAKVSPKDRKVEVSLGNLKPNETATKVSGNFIVRMPIGGVFWASEDPAITAPRLSVNSSQAAKYDGENIYPIRFNYNTNYDAFISKLELSVYLSSDTDLIEPVYQKIVEEVASFGDFSWDEAIEPKFNVSVGDSLIYVLRAYDDKGNIDETQAKPIQLITPEEYDSGLYLNSNTNSQALGQNNSNAIGNVSQSINSQADSINA